MSNQYTYSLPFTKEELRHDYIDNFMSQVEIAKKYNTTQRVVCRAMRNLGIKARKAYKRNQTKENNAYWKGGRWVSNTKKTATVYIMSPDHIYANKKGYVAEHIKLAMEKYGKETIDENELGFHINFENIDNRIENLILCTKKQWKYYYATLLKSIAFYVNNGSITFNKASGYSLTHINFKGYMNFTEENLSHYFTYITEYDKEIKKNVGKHILVAKNKYGINEIPKGFHIHHINENKQDNREENLVLCTAREHNLYHTQLREIARQLIKKYAIHFDENIGYFIKGVVFQ